MELRQLEIFEAVANTESFTAAADRLGYVQSSVSMNILALERELGVPLFDRLGRRVQLTEAGQRFLPHVRQAREILRAAKAAARDTTPRGRLLVGAAESPGTYRLPRIIAAMRQSFPDIEIAVSIGSCDDHRASLRAGRLDAAVMFDEPDESPEFAAVELQQEPIHIVVPPHHPLVKPGPLAPADLAAFTHLATEPGSYRARFEAYLARHGARSPVTELGSVELIKQCIRAGLGYGVLPRMAVEQEIQSGILASFPWPGEPQFMPMRLVRHKGHWAQPALRAFWDTVVRWNWTDARESP